MKITYMETPAGFIAFAWSHRGIAALTLPCPEPLAALEALGRLIDLDPALKPVPPRAGEPARGLEEDLQLYFSGGRPDFSRYAVDLSRHTPFQARVLQAVQQIPYGRTATYGEMAAAAGAPRAYRAAGSAVGANRVLLLIPCHRVIRSDGCLGGFGSSTDWKLRLLLLEGVKVTNGRVG